MRARIKRGLWLLLAASTFLMAMLDLASAIYCVISPDGRKPTRAFCPPAYSACVTYYSVDISKVGSGENSNSTSNNTSTTVERRGQMASQGCGFMIPELAKNDSAVWQIRLVTARGLPFRYEVVICNNYDYCNGAHGAGYHSNLGLLIGCLFSLLLSSLIWNHCWLTL